MHRSRRRSHAPVLVLAAALATIAPTSPVVAQTETPRLRMEFLELQRAYPFANVPAGALQRARQDLYRRFPGLLEADRAEAASLADGERVWQPLGPYRIQSADAGRLVTIAIDPRDTDVIYIGAAQGGVWKTRDGGLSWRPLTDGECSLAMGSIALDPLNPDIVYAGTGELHFSTVSYYGCGVLRSLDGGETWTRLGATVFDAPDGGARISKVIVDRASAGSATGTTVFVSSGFGVFRSNDSGLTWQLSLPGVATDLVVHPDDPRVLYAALGNPAGHPDNGVYRSTDGGFTWAPIRNGFAAFEVGRIALAIAPSAPSTLYAAVQDAFGGAGGSGHLLGIWKTLDGGQSWQKLNATRANCGSQCWYDLVIAVHPQNADRVFFGGVSLFRSENGGQNFSDILGSIHVDQHAIVFDPADPNTMYVGNDGGIYRSRTNGSSWTSLNTDLSITQFYGGISMHPTDPAAILGGTQDNGTVEFAGDPDWARVLGGDGGYTAIDYLDPSVTWAETQWSRGSAFSGPRRRDGAGPYVLKTNGIDRDDRAIFIPPLVMDRADPAVLYFGTYRLYRTADRGESWSAVSGDLSMAGGAISAIAPALSDPSTVWVGTSDGAINVTRDGGLTWTRSAAGLPRRYVRDIDVASGDPLDAVLVVSGFGSGHVFRTVNGGATWSDISGDLPDVPVNAVIRPPELAGTIVIGTDLGVFRSTDGGSSWQPWNAGFPHVAVFDLEWNATTGRLIAATHGRGVYEIEPFADLRVVLSDTLVEFRALGDTARLRATVTSGAGEPADGSLVAWRSTDPSVATVDGGGLVEAAAEGDAFIIASTAGSADTARVAVRQVAVALSGLDGTADLIVDEEVMRIIRAVDARGAPLPHVAVTLESSDPATVAASDDGRLRGVQPGHAWVIGRAAELSDSLRVSVLAPATLTLDVGAAPAPAAVRSRSGERVVLFTVDVFVEGAEAVRVLRLGGEVTGSDRDARLLLVSDDDGDGQPDVGETVEATTPAALAGSPLTFDLQPVNLSVLDRRRRTLLVVLEFGGAAPNGSRFSARFLPDRTQTLNVRSGHRDRLVLPAEPVASAPFETTVLATGEALSLSENPVRSNRLVLNFAQTPRQAAIYTVGGRRVADLIPRESQHRIEWDLTNDEGSRVAPGVYLIVLDVEGRIVRERLIVLSGGEDEASTPRH